MNKIEYVKLGNTGLDISGMHLGCMGFGDAKNGWTKFISMQNHYNFLYREEETPYSPLASGRLTRDWSEKTHRSETDQVAKSKYDATADTDRLMVTRVAEIALLEESYVPHPVIFSNATVK